MAIRNARAVTEEVPEASASSIGAIARMSESNGERDVHRMAQRYKLAMPFQLSVVKIGSEPLHYLKFSEWARFLLRMNLWHHLCGMSQPDKHRAELTWSTFWRSFQKLKPTHPVFQKNNDQLSRTCALMFHGDEGRSQRKLAILILAVHSVLGYGISTSLQAEENTLHKLNYLRTTWVTRFLLGVLPKAFYSRGGGGEDEADAATSQSGDEEATDVCQRLLQVISDDLLQLFVDGITNPHDGQQYYFVVLNVMGDWPWLVKAGCLNRSFMNAAKHATSAKPPQGICHRCCADRPGFPWEDFEAEPRCWVATRGVLSPFQSQPSLLTLPHLAEDPTEFFTWDLFHCWHIGLGKVFLGTCLVLLAMSDLCNGSIPDRLAYLNDRFQSWCRANHQKPYIVKISKEKLNWPSTNKYPQGSWAKGSTTRILGKWFIHECSQIPDLVQADDLLKIAYRAACNIELFLKGIYSHEVWIPRSAAETICARGLLFLRLYGRGAMLCHQRNRSLFMLQPNLHRLDEIIADMKAVLADPGVERIMNPLTASTQADEDFIGKPSRVSRRVAARTIIRRTFQRSMIVYKDEYTNAGILR